MVLDINPADLQHVYEKWGPSVHTCVSLAEKPTLEYAHESAVKSSAIDFISNPRALSLLNYDATNVPYKLFSIHPKAKSGGGRHVLTAEIATDQLRAIISYAAADAKSEESVKFYYYISKEPMFNISQDKIFKCFVLTWLTSSDMASLPCTHANNKSPELKIPSCWCKDTQKICGNLNDLQKMRLNTLPFCFLPSSEPFASVDAIVFTRQFIITIQVTIAQSYDVKEQLFSEIKKSLPAIPTTLAKRGTKRAKPLPTWCHVFITDDNDKARRLQNQKLPELPKGVHIYSTVFDVGQFKSSSDHMRRLDDTRVRGSSVDCI